MFVCDENFKASFYTGRNAILRGICPQIFGLFTVKLAGKHIHLEVYCTLMFDTLNLDALVTFLPFLSRISFDICVYGHMESLYDGDLKKMKE